MILNAMEGKPLPIYGDGQQIRDWLFVIDHCEAIYRVIKDGSVGHTYNIGGNNQPPNLEIVKKLCKILDTKLPDSEFVPHEQLITFVKDRPGHDRRYAIDIGKINQELGWFPRQDLQSGLELTVQWYIDNPDWVVAIRKQTEYQKWLLDNYQKRGGDE